METHLQILDTLAKGIDPATGELLPAESPYNSPDVLRSLFAAIDFIKHPPKRLPKVKRTMAQRQADNVENGLPENAGLPWSEHDRQMVANGFNNNIPIVNLATDLARTPWAIKSELKRQGLIEE